MNEWKKLDKDFDADPTDPTPMKEFFDFFQEVADEDKLAIVTVDWIGCPACASDSEYIIHLQKLLVRYAAHSDIAYGSLHWRSPDYTHLDDPTLIDVVNQSYRLFHQMTGQQAQVYGGRKRVETFTMNPPYWRPKFPQLFFIDGRKFSIVNIDVLHSLFDNEQLFHPFKSPPAIGGDEWVRSGDLNFTDEAVRNVVWNAFGENGVLLQLTNYHLYRAPGDSNEDFMGEAFLETCDHVVEQFHQRPEPRYPQISFRFERAREVTEYSNQADFTPIQPAGISPEPERQTEPISPPLPG